MRLSEALLVAAACISCTLASGLADVIYDSKGFEEYDGFIDDDGQDGWLPLGVYPYTWVGPPSKGNKSIWLRLMFVEDGESGMFRYTDDLIAGGYTRVTVSLDVYRKSPVGEWLGNLWWRCGGDNGNPRAGGQFNMQMPLTLRTYPLIDEYEPFTNDSWVETRFDAWATVELTWDFQAGLAYGSYDGALVSTKYIADFDTFYFYVLNMDLGGAPEDFHQEDVWIDNFIITADKSCYPDCDEGGVLDLFDFLCFVNEFNAGADYADCDGGGALDLFDFLCFVNEFNTGC